MCEVDTTLDDIWQRYQKANLDAKLDLFLETLSVVTLAMSANGQNTRILHELMLELEKKKDGVSQGVLDPISPDNRPKNFGELSKKRHAALAVQIHFLLGKKLDEACELISAELGFAADTIRRWRYSNLLDYEETALFYENLINEENGKEVNKAYLNLMLQMHIDYAK